MLIGINKDFVVVCCRVVVNSSYMHYGLRCCKISDSGKLDFAVMCCCAAGYSKRHNYPWELLGNNFCVFGKGKLVYLIKPVKFPHKLFGNTFLLCLKATLVMVINMLYQSKDNKVVYYSVKEWKNGKTDWVYGV